MISSSLRIFEYRDGLGPSLVQRGADFSRYVQVNLFEERCSSARPGCGRSHLPSAQAACARTSPSGSSFRESARSGMAPVSRALPNATATLRRYPRRLARFIGLPLNFRLNASAVSASPGAARAGKPRARGKGWVACACGQSAGSTGRQSGKCRSQTPIRPSPRSSGGIGPLFSIVRYEMQRLESIVRSSRMASVGQASMQRRHEPQWSVCTGGSGSSSTSSNVSPKQEVRSVTGRDQAGVFANPAQAGLLGEIAFQDGAGIGVCPGLDGPAQVGLQPAYKFFQAAVGSHRGSHPPGIRRYPAQCFARRSVRCRLRVGIRHCHRSRLSASGRIRARVGAALLGALVG
jgi:hypothetical protein